MKIGPLQAAVLGAVAAILCGPVWAAGAKAVKTFHGWSAHVISDKSGRICYVYAKPSESKGKYSARGATYIQVAHRLKAKARNEVSVTAGYTYKKDSGVTVDIDGKKFSMFTSGDTAWSRAAADDAALVGAMRAGKTMVVHGTSSRGTETTDTYQLTGFTAAHQAIDEACNIK